MKPRKTHLRLALLAVTLVIVLAGCQNPEVLTDPANGVPQGTIQDGTPEPSATAADPSSVSTDKRDAGNGLLVPFAQREELLVFVANITKDYNLFSPGNGAFPILDQICENTGVNLRFESPASDYWNVLKTRLAAGTNLPDLIMMQANDDYFSAVNGGLILKISDYLDVMPNLSSFLAANEDARKEWAVADGSIYGISAQIQSIYANGMNINSISYRKDWQTKLGLPDPLTIDDWETMLIAFRDDDPNGNGENDEIPISCGGKTAWNAFSNAYGLNLNMNSGFSVVDGTVLFDYYSEEQAPVMRAYLEKMRHWYGEKLIGNDMLTSDQNTMRAQVLSNVAGTVSGWVQRAYNYNELMKGEVPGVEWVAAQMPETPFGKGSVIVGRPWDSNRFSICAKTKYPEIAASFVDYLLSEEGSMLQCFGIEGEHYELVGDVPQLTQASIDDMKNYNGLGDMIAALGGASRLPHMRLDAMADMVVYSEGTGLTQEIVQHVQSIAAEGRSVYVNRPPLPEHQAAMSKMTDIRTYIDEVVTNIIIGKSDVAEFDTMREKLKGMGIEDVIAAHQELYDLYNK